MFYPGHYPIPHSFVPVTPVSIPYYQESRPDPYPEVDTTRFKQSSDAYQTLIKDSETISGHFSESEQLRLQVMRAAQKNEHDKVVNLIQDIGVTHPFEVSYTPKSIRVTLMDVEDRPTCKLIIALRW